MPERFAIRPDDLGFEPVDDEMLVIDFVTSDYYLINATGAAVWRALAVAPRTADEVAAALAGHEGGEHTAIRNDVDAFFAALAADRLLVTTSETEPEAETEAGAAAAVPALATPYVVPRFEKFGTLERLMLAGE